MKKVLNQTLVLVFMLAFVGCESSNVNQDAYAELIDPQLMAQYVESINIEPASVGPTDEMKVSVNLNKEALKYKLPDALFLRDYPEVAPLRRAQQTATSYFVLTTSEKVKAYYLEAIKQKGNGNTSQGIGFSCDISFSKPGEYDENCDDTCPDKSILGADTLFCVCLFNCQIHADFF